MAFKKQKTKTKFSAGERRAYWIGYGAGFEGTRGSKPGNTKKVKAGKEQNSFLAGCNAGEKEALKYTGK